MHFVRWKKTRVPWAKFTRFTAHFSPSATRQHVANLLNAGMTMRQGSAAITSKFAADHTEQNLKMFGANGLGADQTTVDRVTMVGRAIGGDICFFNEISTLGHSDLS
jgi:hypothetical protein